MVKKILRRAPKFSTSFLNIGKNIIQYGKWNMREGNVQGVIRNFHNIYKELDQVNSVELVKLTNLFPMFVTRE
jgi:hypothetical protein